MLDYYRVLLYNFVLYSPLLDGLYILLLHVLFPIVLLDVNVLSIERVCCTKIIGERRRRKKKESFFPPLLFFLLCWFGSINAHSTEQALHHIITGALLQSRCFVIVVSTTNPTRSQCSGSIFYKDFRSSESVRRMARKQKAKINKNSATARIGKHNFSSGNLEYINCK